jgi:hypothetical protein
MVPESEMLSGQKTVGSPFGFVAGATGASSVCTLTQISAVLLCGIGLIRTKRMPCAGPLHMFSLEAR